MERYIQLTNAKIVEGERLKEHCTYRIGGNAKYYCYVKDIDGLKECIDFANKNNIEYSVIGNGSNVLFDDRDYDGLIINLSGIDRIEKNKSTFICGAGVTINGLLNNLRKYGFLGIEKLYGIPATVGGALCMNASCLGQCISDNVLSVKCLYHGDIISLSKDDCLFGYRNSVFNKKNLINVSCVFDFNISDKAIFEKGISIAKEYRSRQPKGYSCGCVFKNPAGFSAGKLIDDCGLSGYRIGGAFVSNQHANYIINDNNATFSDVKRLIDVCKDAVKKRFNIELTTELKYIGNYNGFDG